MNKNSRNFSKLGWDKLLQIFLTRNNEEKLNNILSFLLTKEEKEKLGKRVVLAQYLINQEKSQREISKELSVSISTVTRCSNALKIFSDKDKELFL